MEKLDNLYTHRGGEYKWKPLGTVPLCSLQAGRRPLRDLEEILKMTQACSFAPKLSVLIAVVCLSGFAADNELTPAERQAGFKLLFDGKSFNNWRDPAGEHPPGDSWVIEDGCLKTTPKPRITEDLISRESFGDFELKFDWRISPHGNTGVKYRIQRVLFLDNSKADRSGGFEACARTRGHIASFRSRQDVRGRHRARVHRFL